MRTRDLVVLTAFTACVLALTAAPGQPQSRIQEPVKSPVPAAPVLTSVPTIAAVPVAPPFPAESGVLPSPPAHLVQWLFWRLAHWVRPWRRLTPRHGLR